MSLRIPLSGTAPDMDLLIWLLIALVVIIVIGVVFAVARSKQRRGTVLASPDTFGQEGGS